MKTWQILLIVAACLLGILSTIAITLVLTSRETHPTKEELLVSQVQAKYPESTNWPANTIVTIAKDTCAKLDSGDSMSNVIMEIATKYPAGADTDYDLIAFTMVTGIKELCPQHIDQAKEFAQS